MKKIRNWLILLLLVVTVFTASLMIGKNLFTITDILNVVSGASSAAKKLTFWDFRFPRSLLALIGGFGIAVSGFLLQGITRNDLADSSILGINSGAGLLVMVYLGFYAQAASWLLPIWAIAGGFLAAAFVVFFAFQPRSRLSMTKVLLTGIAVNSGLSALTLLVTVQLSKERYQFVATWLAGSLWGTNWKSIGILLPIVILLVLLAVIRTPILNYLSLGEEQAVSLGVNVVKERLIFLALAVALAASCVAFTGSLAFVGLLSPHIAKSLLQKESRESLLLSGIIGSLLVMIADILGRIILSSGEIPAGIIISLIGAPYFLWLLLRKKV
ncbi:iron complex transport system permease protein [Enterococcus sp. PF1-24]|uniref:FecCD family ABC transporter permease n=1 Tax=unclassified Enterococcus TaxID=2608891 RepID=UPI00247698A9|nr:MULTISPECIES: iron ABC transporter permease [unclassified Enterococcus]MDH6363713.1 iron complex transport system permease protein [Enterococcus sp. PFB1-1]MDH6400669.1 iron complex transport system permease protein [Enterococcus sp. PF1-24]